MRTHEIAANNEQINRRAMARLSESVDLDNLYDGEQPQITLRTISVIIPVLNNQSGIDRFLDAFLATHPPSHYPKEIIIVDNNSDTPICLGAKYDCLDLNLQLHRCNRPGPAAARNCGAEMSSGDWLLFSDSDCLPTSSFLTGYLSPRKQAVAYAGNVVAEQHNWLSRYYNDEGTLIPYRKPNSNGHLVPLYIVTANTLVSKSAFVRSGCFNETFRIAGGEDVDLGIRLWRLGNIEFCPDSLVLHDFSDGLSVFCRRFKRYGTGNRHLENVTGIDMTPNLRWPRKRRPFNCLAILLQHVCLKRGYSSASPVLSNKNL